jgi:hypothetical protein
MCGGVRMLDAALCAYILHVLFAVVLPASMCAGVRMLDAASCTYILHVLFASSFLLRLSHSHCPLCITTPTTVDHHQVAMANAVDEAKAVARRVSLHHNHESAVAKEIARLIDAGHFPDHT